MYILQIVSVMCEICVYAFSCLHPTRLSPSITITRSRSASNPSSPVNPSAGPSPDKGYLEAVSELQSRLRKVKLEQEEENKSQQPVAELASSSVAEAVRAAVKARRGAAPVIPHLSACESVPHVNNADAIEGESNTCKG